MAGLNIFRKNYTVRRWGVQEVQGCYITAPYQDFKVDLNVQPFHPHETSADAEGSRQHKKLKSFGVFQFTAADQDKGVQGDWLFYRGRWYCCLSAVAWDHTTLFYNKAEWGSIGETEQEEHLAPPDEGSRK